MTTAKHIHPPRRVGLISLGCAKNLVDAEIMVGSLLKQGVEIVNDPAQADAVIVNTCSFIDAAQEESVDTVLESAELRERTRPGQAVIVSGCLPQRFRDDLPALMPEVDAFMGIDQVEQVGRIVEEAIGRRHAAESSKLKAQRSKTQVNAALAELTREHGPHIHDPEESLRGTAKFGRSRQTLAPKPNSPAALTAGGQRAESASLSTLNPQPSTLVSLRPNYIPHYDTPRFRLTPPHFAYVKIAEGCNHPCSFCIIPRMRGSHRSRAQADIVNEARQLIAEGVKELNLISQDSTYYGLDLRPNHRRGISSPERFASATRELATGATTLCSLLRELNGLKGEFWIRLLYTHPAHWTDDLIRTIADCPKVARYVDMPLQHIHDDVLARMRRETGGQFIRDLIGRIRAGIPGIALRTTFIVGFPGETTRHFDTLLDFIRETRFERVGVFAYSQEHGTVAGRMEKQIPVKLRQERRARAMAAQHEVAVNVAESFVGKTLKVLAEGPATGKQLQQANVSSWEHGLLRAGEEQGQNSKPRQSRNPEPGTRNFFVARSEADAPDIDGRVYVRGRLATGEFARVRIIAHTDYDLIAEPQ